MIISHSILPAPGRLRLSGCAIAAGLLAVSAPSFAAPSASISIAGAEKPRALRVGKTETIPLVKPWDYRVMEGFANIFVSQDSENLTLKALSPGPVKIRLFTPDGRTQWVNLDVVAAKSRIALPFAAPIAAPVRKPIAVPVAALKLPPIQTTRNLQIVDRAPLGGAFPGLDTGTVASPTSEQAPSSSPTAAIANPTGALSTASPGAVSTTPPAAVAGTSPFGSAPLQNQIAPALPALGALPVSAATNSNNAGNLAPQISPSLPPPLPTARANVGYRPSAPLPRNVNTGGSRRGIQISQGSAKLLSFPNNVLAVFFSDPSVMDARAINARTIAVTGIGAGVSTLAVFTSREPGDKVGRANIYRIETIARSGQNAVPVRDARTIERAINLALGDPRVRASVIALPDGSLITRLAGTVRNAAEVQAAISTASFYVPSDRVISSLYADINAPTLDAVLASGSLANTPESGLQENLRRITGNRSIELVSLPTGLAFKAEVNSADEAQSLLRVLPSLNQQVIPFIVIRGQNPASSPYYNTTIPVLSGEDRQLTQKLQDVTGVNTVYAVRASSNGLACYGTVRTRTDYNTVRRYMLAMAQSSAPPALQGTSQGGTTLRPQGYEGPILPANDISGGYLRNLGLQMFVRITDPGQSVIRKVTVETSIVEISRTALKNLGVEVGSATLLGRSITLPTINPLTGGQITPGVNNSTIDPTFRPGLVSAGNGFSGNESLQILDPFRARINALVNNGNARILSQPNVSAVEGAAAQITIGGERPVPKVVATVGAVGTQVEFRRYGVIISMRPTVTGENTILLQIRADVTAPDRTFEINIGGSLVPGEAVRSVDTTINVRPGDTVVMGGLITNEKRQQLSKVPILGDLPIIGSLFRSKRFDNNETELAIFMSPRIESMPADMESIEEMNRIPALPALPSRDQSNAILFQTTTRSAS